MRFKLDENLPVELAADPRLAGHESDTVADEGLEGADDVTVVAAAFREGRILLTLDKGFAAPESLAAQRYWSSSDCGFRNCSDAISAIM